MWTYRCYDDGSDPNLWQRWYVQNPDAHGSHDAVFRMLEQMKAWREPHAKLLKNYDQLVEIRLSGDLEHRIFGMYAAGRQFIVLATGYHKQKVYSPKDVLKTATKRKKEVLLDPERTVPCVRPE